MPEDNVHLFDAPEAEERMVHKDPANLHHASSLLYARMSAVRGRAFSAEERQAAWKLLSVVGGAIEGDEEQRVLMLELSKVAYGGFDEAVRRAVAIVQREFERWEDEQPSKATKAELLRFDLSKVDPKFKKLTFEDISAVFEMPGKKPTVERALALLAAEVRAMDCAKSSLKDDVGRFRKSLDRLSGMLD